MNYIPCVAGIDFGTTSLSAVVINTTNNRIEKVFSKETNAYLPFTDDKRKEQSIERLSKLFLELLTEIDNIPNIKILSYGFTGQMHGIIGLNNRNEAVTNLVTWQDKSGNILLPEGISLLDKIKSYTKDALAEGYGIIALYKWINCENRTDITSFCTVADYFAMQLAQSTQVVMHATNAHSIGLFDIHSSQWNNASIDSLQLDRVTFPEVTTASTIIGYRTTDWGQVPVTCAIGDNQASFIGSVTEREDSLLLNIGTGAQLSFLIKKEEEPIYRKYIDGYETQLRPFDEKSYLVATSFISGGSVYKSLFSFFKDVATSLFDLNEIDDNQLWKNMEKAGKSVSCEINPVRVIPLLEGKRNDLSSQGSIANLSTSNFNSGNLIAGFLKGLAEYYKTGYFPELKDRIKNIYGSGNGLKRNTLFKQILDETFERQLLLTDYDEEAAVGAALNQLTIDN